MSKPFTRKRLLAGAAPLVAAGPFVGHALARGGGGQDHAHGEALGHTHREATHLHTFASHGHAAMIGESVPAPEMTPALESLLRPPEALPHRPGRVREYELVARDVDLEVAKGVVYPAWTYNGTAPGPVIRATEDDLLRVRFRNEGSHPHTIHFHGIHPATMDGVFEVIPPGGAFTYEFPAKPWGMHLYHCHATPLKKHIQKGLYGAFIVDPPKPRKPAQELVMVMNGFDTDGDGENNFYAVNGPAFLYARYPIQVRRSQTVRIYLANLTEFDLINSFHLHGDFFRYYRTGRDEVVEYTDTVMLTQGERGIIEIDFSNTGRFMFHAHQSEFAELGWMGFFEVVE
jgi:FtsP/CotA-like multicopper oxidase with cupredoxin domain